MELLEDDSCLSDEGNEENKDSVVFSEDHSESDGSESVESVPAHIRALPWPDRMKALGLSSDAASAPASSSTG